MSIPNLSLINQRQLIAILHKLVEGETEPCRFDMWGDCMAHSWTTSNPGECGVQQARKLLGLSQPADQPAPLSRAREKFQTSPLSVITERTEAARQAIQRSDQAAFHVTRQTGPEVETMELRTAVRALIQEIEYINGAIERLNIVH